jgi:hypothetical protein
MSILLNHNQIPQGRDGRVLPSNRYGGKEFSVSPKQKRRTNFARRAEENLLVESARVSLDRFGGKRISYAPASKIYDS